MVQEERPFTGILYAGLIETDKGPKVIEFNARFGDPETQVVLPLLKNDLEQVFLDVMDGKDPELQWSEESCAGVVVASSGYPGGYVKGRPLPALETSDSAFLVHAGTALENGTYVSDGGRVLLVGSKGNDLSRALDCAYEALRPLHANEDFSIAVILADHRSRLLLEATSKRAVIVPMTVTMTKPTSVKYSMKSIILILYL